MLRLGGQWCGCEAGHCQLTEEEPSLRRRLPTLLLLLEAEPNATCSRPSMISPQDFKLSHNVSCTNFVHLSLSWHHFYACWQQYKARNELDVMAKGCYSAYQLITFSTAFELSINVSSTHFMCKIGIYTWSGWLKPGCGWFYINWHLLPGLGDFPGWPR